MTISKGVEIRSFYRQKANLLICNNPGRLDLVDADMASYEKDLKDMLQVHVYMYNDSCIVYVHVHVYLCYSACTCMCVVYVHVHVCN